MSVELVVGPDDELVGSDLDEAKGRNGYAASVENVLEVVIAASRVEAFEIDGLIVDRPLSNGYATLHDGLTSVRLRR